MLKELRAGLWLFDRKNILSPPSPLPLFPHLPYHTYIYPPRHHVFSPPPTTSPLHMCFVSPLPPTHVTPPPPPTHVTPLPPYTCLPPSPTPSPPTHVFLPPLPPPLHLYTCLPPSPYNMSSPYVFPLPPHPNHAHVSPTSHTHVGSSSTSPLPSPPPGWPGGHVATWVLALGSMPNDY